MKLQQIKIIDPVTLETTIMNVPCERKEKILCTEPYVLTDYKRYNLDGTNNYESVASFESMHGTQLIPDAIVSAQNNDKYYIQANSKYDYVVEKSKEDENVKSALADGVYKMPVSVSFGKNHTVSISGGLREHTKRDILNSIITTNRCAYNCTVVRCTTEGYVVNIQGIECYMPGGAASLYKLKNYESIVGKEMMVVPVAYNKVKDCIIVSHIEYINTIKASVIDQLLQDCEGKKFKGTVTLKKHNYLLVTFNEFLTGKLTYDDMDEETKRKFINDEFVKEESEIEFYIDFENNNMITLTQTYRTRDLWKNVIPEEFVAGKTYKGVIGNVSQHGVLVKLKYDIISSMKRLNNDTREYHNGDSVVVRIKDIDYEKRLVSIVILNNKEPKTTPNK